MKNVLKSAKSDRSFDLLISEISENEVLTIQGMKQIRGGDAEGEGNGGATVIIIPR
jgi:hypothetical protein